MLALDAQSHACPGLVTGQIWTRPGRITVPHEKRRPQEKESWRWISTAEQAKDVLSAATMVTVIDDREGDIHAKWASVPSPNCLYISPRPPKAIRRLLRDTGSL
jgi:hypothetical protein